MTSDIYASEGGARWEDRARTCRAVSASSCLRKDEAHAFRVFCLDSLEQAASLRIHPRDPVPHTTREVKESV
jgi:hypothetical protein